MGPTSPTLGRLAGYGLREHGASGAKRCSCLTGPGPACRALLPRLDDATGPSGNASFSYDGAARCTATGDHLLALGAFESLMMVDVTRQPQPGTRSTSFVPRREAAHGWRPSWDQLSGPSSLISPHHPLTRQGNAYPFPSIDDDTRPSGNERFCPLTRPCLHTFKTPLRRAIRRCATSLTPSSHARNPGIV